MECLICSAWFWPLVDAVVSMTVSFAVLQVWSLHSGQCESPVKVLHQYKRSSSSDAGDSTPPGGEWQLCPRGVASSRHMDVGEQLAEMIHDYQETIQPTKPLGGTLLPHCSEIPQPVQGPSFRNPHTIASVLKEQNISFPTYDQTKIADLLSDVEPFSSSSSSSENESDMEIPALSTWSESSGAWEVMSSSSEIHTTADSHYNLERQPSRETQWKKPADQTYNTSSRTLGALPECSETPSRSWHKREHTSKSFVENQCTSESNVHQVNSEHLVEVSHENQKIIQITEHNEAVSRQPFCKNLMRRDNNSPAKLQNIRCVSKKQNVSFRTNDKVKLNDGNVHYCYSANELLRNANGHLEMERRTMVRNTQIKTVSVRDDEGAQHEKLRDISAIASSNVLPRLPHNSVSWNPQESGDQETSGTYFGDLAKKLTNLLYWRPQLSPVSFEDQATEAEISPASDHEVLNTDLKTGSLYDMSEERVKDPVVPFNQTTGTGGRQSRQIAQCSKSLESFFARRMNETLDCHVRRKKQLNVSGLTGLIHHSFHTFSSPALTCSVSQRIRRPAVLWVPLLSELDFFSAEAQKCLEFHIQKITVHLKLGQPARIKKSVEAIAPLVLQEANYRCLLPCHITESLSAASTEGGSRRPLSAPSYDTQEKDIILMSPTSIVEEVHCTSPVSTFPHQLTSKEDHRRLLDILKEFLRININRMPHITKRQIEDIPQKRQPNLPKLLSTGERKIPPVTKSVPLLGAYPRGHMKLKDGHECLSSLWALSNPYMCFLAGLIPRAPASSSPIATYNAKVGFAGMKTISHSRDVKQMFTLHTREEKQQAQSGRVLTNQRSLKKLLPPHPQLIPKDLKWPEQEAVVVIGKLSFSPGEEIRSIEFRIRKSLPHETCQQAKTETEQETLRLSMRHSPPAANGALTYAADTQKHLLLELRESSSSTSSLQLPSKTTGSATAFSAPEVMQKMLFHLVRKSVEIRMKSLPPRVKKSHDLVYLPEKSLLPKLVPTDKLPMREWKKFDLCICRHARNRINLNIRNKRVASLFKLPTVYSESLDKMINSSPRPPFLSKGGGDPAELLVKGPALPMQSNTKPMTTRPPATPPITFETHEIESTWLNTPFITTGPKGHPEMQTKKEILQEDSRDFQLHDSNSEGTYYHSENINTNASCNASNMYDEPQAQIPRLTNVCANQMCRKHPLRHLKQKPRLDALVTPLDEIECSDHSEMQKINRGIERIIKIEESLENRPVSYPDADTVRSSFEACLVPASGSVPEVQGEVFSNENATRDDEHGKKIKKQKEAISDLSNCNVDSGNPGTSIGQEIKIIPNFRQYFDTFCSIPHMFKTIVITEKETGPKASEREGPLLNSSHVSMTNNGEGQKLIRAPHMQRNTHNTSLKVTKKTIADKAEKLACTRRSEKPISGLALDERPIPESRLEKSQRTRVPHEEHNKSTRLKEPYLGTKRGYERSWLQNEVVCGDAGEVNSVRSGSSEMKERKAGIANDLTSERQMHMKQRHNMWLLSKDYREMQQRPPNPNPHSCSLLARLLG